MDSLLPYHTPERVEGGGQWALGADVSSGFVVAVNVVGVHVFHGLLLSRERAQGNPRVVI